MCVEVQFYQGLVYASWIISKAEAPPLLAVPLVSNAHNSNGCIEITAVKEEPIHFHHLLPYPIRFQMK